MKRIDFESAQRHVRSACAPSYRGRVERVSGVLVEAHGVPAAVGETCRDLRACAEGLYCQWTETTCNDRDPVTQECLSEHLVSGVCSAPSAEGEPCGRFVDCGRGMICVRARGSDDGVCTALPRDYCEGGLQKLARQASKVQ